MFLLLTLVILGIHTNSWLKQWLCGPLSGGSQFNYIVIWGYTHTHILKVWIEITCKMIITFNWHFIIVVSCICVSVALHLLTCKQIFAQANTAELSFYTSHPPVVAMHFFPLPSVLFIIRHLSIFRMLHPTSLSIWPCLCLSSFPSVSVPCPFLRPSFLIGCVIQSESLCHAMLDWTPVCVCVCVWVSERERERMVAGCWSLLTNDTRAFGLGIQKLIAAPSLQYCTYPSPPTSHPSSSLPWY